MQKKTYGDKQREAQQLKKQEEKAKPAKNSPAPKSSEADAVAETTEAGKKKPKADKRGRRPV